jgi:FkbM family methyltransferase
VAQVSDWLGYDRNNKLFLDVGANIGTFSTVVAQLGHEVIAVEPFKLNVPLIRETMCLNKWEQRISLYKAGLADVSPGVDMCIWSTNSDINNGNARMSPYFTGRKISVRTSKKSVWR